jgi:hypothetical protein
MLELPEPRKLPQLLELSAGHGLGRLNSLA